MQLNKIKRLQYYTPPGNNNFNGNTIFVSQYNSFDYPDSTPLKNLLLPFTSVIRARDYLAAHNKNYTIRVLPGEYVVHPGEDLDYAGEWVLDEGANIQVIIGQGTVDEYLFNGTAPIRVSGKGTITFGWTFGRLFNPSGTFTPGAIIEAKVIRSFFSLLDAPGMGYTGEKCTFKNVLFECIDNAGKNLFIHSDLKGQSYHFEDCNFTDYRMDMDNYSEVNFYNCSFNRGSNEAQVVLGSGTTTDPNYYAVSFVNCDFNLRYNNAGGIRLKNTGVRLCISRSRFNGGDLSKYSISNDFVNTVAVNAIGTAPLSGSMALNNVYGSGGFQYINPALLPYLITI